MSVPPGTEMFQFPGFASRAYGFGPGYPLRGGFPHSDIRGSTIARISPRLIAACHVLHRLLAPRHPPNALVTLRICRRRPHAGPSRASSGRCPARIALQAAAHSRSRTTQPFPDSPEKEQRPCPRLAPAGSAFWKRPGRAHGHHGRAPRLRAPRCARRHRAPAARALRRDGVGRMPGHREWRAEPAEGCSLVRIGRNRDASAPMSRPSLKGGDPAAGSPTATLLRLHPSRRPHRGRLPPIAGLAHRLRVEPTPMV
jgi:hypothetical protein